MTQAPERNRNVYFLGAGFSKAFGLPNTAELLTEIHKLSDTNPHWGVSRNLPERLRKAYKYFYPEDASNFQPPVGDFFTVLSTHYDIADNGLPEAFSDPTLLSDLKFAIAHILCVRMRTVDEALARPHEFLDEIIQPGNIVVTSNWDFLLERACIRRKIPFRLRWRSDDNNALTILKLHGSIDWTTHGSAKTKAKAWTKTNFRRLKALTLPNGARQERIDKALKARRTAIENWSRSYRLIKACTTEPLMVTMAHGKADGLAPLSQIWSDAYHALSRAKHLWISGYSMPEDDVEIRTLLRSGVRRGNTEPRVTVQNPAPEVHVRLRQHIFRELRSDYSTVPSLS